QAAEARLHQHHQRGTNQDPSDVQRRMACVGHNDFLVRTMRDISPSHANRWRSGSYQRIRHAPCENLGPGNEATSTGGHNLRDRGPDVTAVRIVRTFTRKTATSPGKASEGSSICCGEHWPSLRSATPTTTPTAGLHHLAHRSLSPF